MAHNKLRRRIAWEAARLMYTREESEYIRAKRKASRRVTADQVKPRDLPSNREIRDQLQTMAHLLDGEGRRDNLRLMRLETLRVMRLLAAFRPRLIGSTLTGHARRGSDIDIHVFSASSEAVCAVLEDNGIVYDLEKKRILEQGQERIDTHVRFHDQYPFDLTLYAPDKAQYVLKSSITGRPIERATIAELEQMLVARYTDATTDQETLPAEGKLDRFQVYEMLLLPLEKVKESRKWHPEGDALYHSLQVFDLARDELPYDEEFLLAALLHDVGKAIDRGDHTAAGLEALEGVITPRCRWLIEHHTEGRNALTGGLGQRHRRRLQASEDYETLLLLAQCDAAGRQRGVQAPDVYEALDYLRELAVMCGEGMP